MFLLLIIMIFMNTTQATSSLIRKDFFKNIIGLDEKTFREQFCSQERSYYLDPHNKDIRTTLFNLNKRSAAIFQGNFRFYNIQELDDYLEKNDKPVSEKPLFSIAIFDPCHPEQSNIRAFQQDPSYKHALFQIESTLWGPLERGIYCPQAFLSDMLKNPGKGEEASIATAAATIYRKYCMPYCAHPEHDNRYLLSNLFKKLPYIYAPSPDRTQEILIDPDYVNQYCYNQDDLKKIKVGIHSNIVVCSGYSVGTKPDDSQPELFIAVNDDQIIDKEKTQLITQIFTSAYNTRHLRYNPENNAYDKKLSDNAISLAKLLLKAAYEATFKAAVMLNQPKIIITLLGSRASLNELAWISQALESLESFIVKHGLQITLIYRVDKYRRGNAPRTSSDDLIFLNSIIAMACRINKQELPEQELIKEYVQESYNFEKQSVFSDEPACQYYKEITHRLKKSLTVNK